MRFANARVGSMVLKYNGFHHAIVEKSLKKHAVKSRMDQEAVGRELESLLAQLPSTGMTSGYETDIVVRLLKRSRFNLSHLWVFEKHSPYSVLQHYLPIAVDDFVKEALNAPTLYAVLDVDPNTGTTGEIERKYRAIKS